MTIINNKVLTSSLLKEKFNSESNKKSQQNISYSKIITDFKNLSTVLMSEDLHLETIQQQIKCETSNICGIYFILNKATLDYYIGFASTNRLYIRFKQHLF